MTKRFVERRLNYYVYHVAMYLNDKARKHYNISLDMIKIAADIGEWSTVKEEAQECLELIPGGTVISRGCYHEATKALKELAEGKVIK